jgi:phage shock protein A
MNPFTRLMAFILPKINDDYEKERKEKELKRKLDGADSALQEAREIAARLRAETQLLRRRE